MREHPEKWAEKIPKLFTELVTTPLGIEKNLAAAPPLLIKALSASPEKLNEYHLRRVIFHERWSPPRDLIRESWELRQQKKETAAAALHQLQHSRSTEKTAAEGVFDIPLPTGGSGGSLGGVTPDRPTADLGVPPFPQPVNPPEHHTPSHGFFSAVRPLPLDATVDAAAAEGEEKIQDLRAQVSPAAVAFWSMVEPEGDCWLWIGPRTASGWPVDAFGRLAGRVAYLSAASGAHRLKARAAELAGAPWAIDANTTCPYPRVCIRPSHRKLRIAEVLTGGDFVIQRRLDRGEEHCLSAGTPPEVAYRLTRDAGMSNAIEAFDALVARMSSHMDAWLNKIDERLSISERLSARHDETIAAIQTETAHLKRAIDQLTLTRLDAPRHESIDVRAERFSVATGDQTSVDPPTRTSDRCESAEPSGGSAEDVVQELPLVSPPGSVLFEKLAVGVHCRLATESLEEMGALGSVARVWALARPGAKVDRDELQLVAEELRRLLVGTLYDQGGFVYALSLLLEAAAMDAACDGTLGWVRENAYRYVDGICERLLGRPARDGATNQPMAS